MKKLTAFNEINTFLNSEGPKPVEIKTIPNMMHAKYANEHFIEPLQKGNSTLREQNTYLRKNISLITNQVKLIEHSEKEYRELKRKIVN